MTERLRRACHNVHQTYQAGGLPRVLRRLARALLGVLYQRDMQYIILKRVERQEAVRSVPGEESERGTECVIVDSAAALQEVAREFPATMRDSAAQLQTRLDQGCLVILVRRLHPAGSGHDVIGYGIHERGVFSALGRRGQVASDLLFNHYVEVLPAYRGQRVWDVMRRALEEYCRAHGVTKRCAVVSPTNEPSLRSNRRYGATIVGTVARVSILWGLFVWETPWERIEKALRVGDDAERLVGGA